MLFVYVAKNRCACIFIFWCSIKTLQVDKMNETVKDKVEKAIEELRPHLQADGGDVELFGVENGIVKVKMKGACADCPMSAMTLHRGIENFLKKKIPEIVRVEAVQ